MPNFVIVDAGLPYVLIVVGTRSIAKAKHAIACSWPLFYREGKQLLGRTGKTAIIIDQP